MFGFPSLQTIGAVGVVVAALLAYNSFIDNPHVRALARAGYVTEATQAALQAELDETIRQRDAAQKSSDAWMGRLSMFQRDQESKDEQSAKEIADLEAKTIAAGDSCTLKLYQLNGLLQHGK